MTLVNRGGARASLRNRNYRLFFAGQLVSSVGTWLHQIAESWLVLQLTGSGFAVGVVVACRFLPVLLLGLWAGALADRHDRRTILYATQSVRALAAAVLGVLTLTGHVTTVIVLVLAVVGGTANAIDNPVRRAFIGQLVDDDLILNAVSLNSTVMATSRVVGPLLAGVMIATIGVGWCFTINGISYAAMILGLRAMDGTRFRPVMRGPGATGTVREGLGYVRSSAALYIPLAMVAVVSAFAWNWEIILALHATTQFGGGARLYTLMFASLSLGTFVGALVNAGRGSVAGAQLAGKVLGLSAALLGVALATNIVVTLVFLGLSGVGAALFNTASNAVVQVAARGEFHGRVMALFSILFVGTKGIGGVAVGAVAEGFGTRVAIVASAAACLVAAAIGHLGVEPRGATA